MTKKEIKAAQAEFHAFIKSQQKPEVEANIAFMDGDKERLIPVTIKQRLSAEDKIMFVNRAVGFCVDEDFDEIYPTNLNLGFKMALVEFYTDIKTRAKEEDFVEFVNDFDIAQFLCDETAGEVLEEIKLMRAMCEDELKWRQRQMLNNHGVNGVFIKLENLLDKIDMAVDSVGGYMGEDKLNELLDAVKTVAEAPEKVSEKIIETERARAAAAAEKENTEE